VKKAKTTLCTALGPSPCGTAISGESERDGASGAKLSFPKLNPEGRRPIMSIIKKAPAILAREFRIEEPVSVLLDDYAQFIDSSPDHVINSALKKTLWRDQDYRKWREQRKNSGGEAARHGSTEGPAKP